MTKTVLVVGHLPPPVTGENLCRARLVLCLRKLGCDVRDVSRSRAPFVLRRYDTLVVVNGESVKGTIYDVALTLWGLLFCRRVLWYFHNRSWERFLIEPISRMFRNSSKVVLIVLSAEIAGRLRSRYRQVVILNNTPERVFDEYASQYIPAKFKKRLLWVGRPDKVKGFETALDCVRLLRKADAEWVLEVYGIDEASACRKGLCMDGVRFKGFVAGAEKLRAFKEGGIFILPSKYRNETQPLSIIEALAVGVPIVASAIGGIPDMLADGADIAGFAVESEDPMEYVATIQKVVAHYGELSAAAQKVYASKFGSRSYERKVAELFGING